MSFADISARMKQKRDQDLAATQPEARNFDEIYAIRTRILGVLIRDARLASGTTQEETATELEIDAEDVREWEYGKQSPSLPQLELMAFYFDVPLSQFWSEKTLSQAQQERSVPVPKDQYNEIRNRMVSTALVIARREAKLSQEEVAQAAGLAVEQLQQYESGVAIPFPQLTSLASAVRRNMSYFLEGTGRIGMWLQAQEEYARFSELPTEIRTFVSKPVNQPYLEVAMKLAAMPRDELRLLAEKILDITL